MEIADPNVLPNNILLMTEWAIILHSNCSATISTYDWLEMRMLIFN